MKSWKILSYFLIGLISIFSTLLFIVRDFKNYIDYIKHSNNVVNNKVFDSGSVAESTEFNNYRDLVSSVDGHLYVEDFSLEEYKDTNTSPFSQLSDNDYNFEDITNREFLVDFYTFMDSMFYSFPSGKSWDGWERENYYVSSYILGIDKEARSLELYIALPENKVFSNVWLEPDVKCSVENSAILSNYNFELRQLNIDIFSYIEEGDALFTYCLDDECKSIGKSCILIKKEKNEEQ